MRASWSVLALPLLACRGESPPASTLGMSPSDAPSPSFVVVDPSPVGHLHADVTSGYGPETFVIGGPSSSLAYPCELEAHYYRRGPMGYGMGMLQIVQHDGAGGIRLESRPFVVMNDDAFIPLGTLEGPL